jgi:mRNA interferase RelE/StbE
LAWQIEFDPDALKDLRKLDKPIQIRLVGFLRTRVSSLTNPRDIGEALSGQRLGNYWKYRVGDWRIICDIQDQKILVRVLRIGNRREVYPIRIEAQISKTRFWSNCASNTHNSRPRKPRRSTNSMTWGQKDLPTASAPRNT